MQCYVTTPNLSNRNGEPMRTTEKSTAVEQSKPNPDLPSMASLGAVLGVKDIEQASRFYEKGCYASRCTV